MHNKSSNKSFGIVFFIFFLILGFWPLLNNEKISFLFLIISFIFLILGLLNSKILTVPNRAWIKLGFFLGSIISPIVLVLFYFFIFFPMGIYAKISKKELLKLKINKDPEHSYWIDRHDKSDITEQF